MLIHYYKGDPSTFLIAYKSGKAKHSGPGKSLWYTPHNTTLATVPLLSRVTPLYLHGGHREFPGSEHTGATDIPASGPHQSLAVPGFHVG